MFFCWRMMKQAVLYCIFDMAYYIVTGVFDLIWNGTCFSSGRNMKNANIVNNVDEDLPLSLPLFILFKTHLCHYKHINEHNNTLGKLFISCNKALFNKHRVNIIQIVLQ